MNAELYSDNAAGMWASLAPMSRVAPEPAAGLSVFEIAAQSVTRVIVRRPLEADPGQIGELVAAARGGWRIVVEDSFGTMALPSGDGVSVDRMPLMVRPPGGAGPDAPDGNRPARDAGIRVVRAQDPATLAVAERVIVEGFPRRALQPFIPGRMIPPHLLTTPAWQTWLAFRADQPAAAGCTYDDGTAVGVYWLATLPRHRGTGLGRAVMSAMLAAFPTRPATLVATAAGEPLYASLGFRPVAEAAWYRIPGGQGGRG